MKLGAGARGTLDVGTAMSILRDHGQENFRPGRGDMSCLCLHATGVTTPSQTTGSLVAEIRPNGHSTFWLTGSAAPCLSIYKPFFPKDRTILLGSFQEPSEKPDGSLWWTQEKFHRSMLGVYAQMHPRYAVERDALEAEFREKEKTAHSQSQKDREAFSVDCLTRSQALTAKWTELVRKEKNRTFAPLYNMSWKRWNREAGIA